MPKSLPLFAYLFSGGSLVIIVIMFLMVPPKPPGDKVTQPEGSFLWENRDCGTTARICRVKVDARHPGEVSMLDDGKAYNVSTGSLIFSQASKLGCVTDSPCTLVSQVVTGSRDYTRYTFTKGSETSRTIRYEGLHISLE